MASGRRLHSHLTPHRSPRLSCQGRCCSYCYENIARLYRRYFVRSSFHHMRKSVDRPIRPSLKLMAAVEAAETSPQGWRRLPEASTTKTLVSPPPRSSRRWNVGALTRCLLDTMTLESIVSKLWRVGSELLCSGMFGFGFWCCVM